MRVIASEPAFQAFSDTDGLSRHDRPVRIMRRSMTVVYEKVKTHRKKFFFGGISVGAIAGIAFLVVLIRTSSTTKSLICGDERNYNDIVHYSTKTDNLVAVNLGGWLCLEDWFFSGAVGRYVSTPDKLPGQGACLPPKLPGPLPRPWASEGQLANWLTKEHGAQFTVDVFKAHRETFITQLDYSQIAGLGIRSVRIPMSWVVFADALAPVNSTIYGSHDPLHDSVVVPDPFYHETLSAVTVPRAWLADQLRQAAAAGLRVILDIHSMPGGSSDGTYSGIWPLRPQFWQNHTQVGGRDVPLLEVGSWLAQALIDWVQSLDDLLDGRHIWGLCFLNEPAHQSANAPHQWASEQQVLQFIEMYATKFRASSLPDRGVRLYVQVIETAFKNFDVTVPPWYHQFFTSAERHSWAVMARHFYTAWGPTQGLITQGGGYQCDEPLYWIRGKLADTIYSFAGDFAEKFDGLRAVTEFSLGTSADADLACTSSDVLRIVFEENVKAYLILDNTFKIEPFFWTWRMPYGPKFQPGWSLKYFSGMAKDEAYSSDGRCVVGAWAKANPLGSHE